MLRVSRESWGSGLNGQDRTADLETSRFGSGVANIDVTVAPDKCFLEVAWDSGWGTRCGIRCELDSTSNLLYDLRELPRPV